jgi:hypothetical protein
METFKIVVDGVKLDAEQRKQLETGIERLFLEIIGPDGEKQIKLGPYPKLPRVKAELINGRYAILALEREHEMEDKLTQIGRAGLIEQAALQPATFKASTGPGG